jgi:hypothetical protein
MAVPTLSTGELASLLRSSPHELSPAVDDAAPPVAVVRLAGAPLGAEPPPVHSGIGTVLVGVGDAADPAAGLCDVVLGPDDPVVEAIVATVGRHPDAAAALVGLLRGHPGRSLDDGLLLESAVYSALQAGAEHQAWRAAHPVRGVAEGDGPPVLVERAGSTLALTLNRPARHNALSRGMRDGLLEALEVARLDPGVRVELRGAGPSFCSGGDLAEFGSATDPGTAHLVRLQASVARVLAGLSGRVTVHLHGACMGAGIELPAFAGRVTAAPDSRIALPELRLGLIPGAGGTVSLPHRIGRQRTARLALSGEVLDATTALAWGLVDEVVAS